MVHENKYGWMGGRGATSYCTKRGSIRMALNSLLTQHEKLHFSNLNTGITGKILNIKTDQIWFTVINEQNRVFDRHAVIIPIINKFLYD